MTRSLAMLDWLIELEVDYQQWRRLTKAKVDDRVERVRWIKMCHRLGSTAAKDIIANRRYERARLREVK